jgi:hypothetical protein
MDGLSFMSFMSDLTDPDPASDEEFDTKMANISSKIHPKQSWISILLISLQLIFVAPFQFIYKTLTAININMWTSSARAARGHPGISAQRSYDLIRLKEISKSLGHNISVLTAGIITGAMREEMRGRGDSSSSLSICFILPSPNHPHRTKLTNHL